MIRWVFFDVGNVIMNDDPVMAFLYAELHHALEAAGEGMPFPTLLAEREADIAARGAGHWYRLGERYLGTDGLHALMHHCASQIRSDYMAYHNILPGMAEALERLAGEFSLGLLANQLRESVDALSACGLRRHFSVLALSELVEHKKPEPGIFVWALREGRLCAERSGDGGRPDRQRHRSRASRRDVDSVVSCTTGCEGLYTGAGGWRGSTSRVNSEPRSAPSGRSDPGTLLMVRRLARGNS